MIDNTIYINGELKPFTSGAVSDFIKRLGYEPLQRGIAVAVNDEVIPRRDWAMHVLQPGDRVEVVVATQGG
jgi:sulfur carrier protein